MAHPFDGLRLSDGDRTRARKRLVREHRRGRIDATELEERLDAVATARSHGDLAPVFADLDPYAAARGGGPGPRARRYRPAFRRGPFPFPLLPLLVIAIVVAATGHFPWIAVAIIAAVLVLTAPWRWSRRARWTC